MSLFIDFEGPEGSGKTTQIRKLVRALAADGHDVLQTREPGGTPIGEQIRTVLHALDNKAMLPVTEALLYSAARAQHVRQVIGPALERGAIVVTDRFAASTLAYQGYGHGLDLDMLHRITAWATGGLYPDFIIYLDLEVTIGLERKWREHGEGQGEWNRMDEQSLAFHRQVRRGYLQMAQEDSQQWLVLDATQSVEAIHRQILDRIESLIDIGISVATRERGE